MKELESNIIKCLDSLPPEMQKQFVEELISGTKLVRKDTEGFELLEKMQNIIVKDGIDPSVHDDKPYLITTQTQRYLDKTLPSNANNACVILGAGDTVIELISRGVKEIIAIDKNELQTIIYKLKKASILSLSPEDFERFLIDPTNKYFMSQEIFKYVKDALAKEDPASNNIWETIIELNPSEDLANHAFRGVGGDIYKTRYALPYLKKKSAYYNLRQKLEQAQVTIKIEDAISYLLNNPNEKFDYIDITNILLFIAQKTDDKSKYYEELNKLYNIFNNNLQVGGTLALDYWFGVGIRDLKDIKSGDIINRTAKEIYNDTYQELSKYFDIESLSVEKLIDGFGPNPDTVLLTRKRKTN